MGFRLGQIRVSWWAFAAVASLVTMVLAGAVAIVATPAGCRAAQQAGLHVNVGKCGGNAANSPVAGKGQPSPIGNQSPVFQTASPTFQTASPSFPAQPSPSPLLPYEYSASSTLPPYVVNSSSPLPLNVTLTCRLPIYVGPPGSGGFVVFPGGSFVADPRSGVTLPAGLPSPNPGYGGFQSFGLSYDRINGRWLPVPRNWASPDGSRYAYPGPDGIYIVNASDNTFSELGQGKVWGILTVDTQGVYATVQNAAGLWLLPFTGAAQQITAAGYWQAVGGGAAYGTELSAAPNGVSNPLIHLDLKTGAKVPWFMADGGQSQVVGFDKNGSPFIQVNTFSGNNGPYLWWAPSVGGAQMIAIIGGYQATFSPNWPPIADQHGTWFGGGNAIFIFIPNQGMYTAVQIGGQLAGDCG